MSTLASFTIEFATFLAQTTARATTQPEAPWYARLISQSGLMFPLLLLVLFFLFMSKSKRKQEREKQDMLGSMKRGDRVQTIGGILGKVVEAEPDKVLLKVDESSNTKIWFSRSAIHRVISEEKAESN